MAHPWASPRMLGGTTGILPMRDRPLDTVLLSMQVRETEPHAVLPVPSPSWSLRSSPACTTSRTRSRATRGPRSAPPASSCASTGCVTARRCPTLDEVDGLLSLGGEQSVRDIDADPMLTAEAALIGEAVERGCRCSASASARSCSPTPSARACTGCRSGSSAVDADRGAAGRGRRSGGRLAAGRRRRAALARGRLRAAAGRRRAAAPARPHHRGLPLRRLRVGRAVPPRGPCRGPRRLVPAGHAELPEAGDHRGAGSRGRRPPPARPAARSRTRCSAASPRVVGESAGADSLASSLREHRVA